MCGIVGYIGEKKAVPILINGLLSLEYRGYDSSGIAVINSLKKKDDCLQILKSKGRVKALEENKLLKTLDGTTGIAHTRWATHGIPSDVNAHPHTDNSKTFAVVHNGIIENYNELKSFLLDKGYTFKSETDTEIIPNLISYYYEKFKKEKSNSKCTDEELILKAVKEAVNAFVGSFAIEVVSPLLDNTIIVAKKDSPMVIGKGKNEFFVASDIPAILKYTKEFYFMEDGEIAKISKDSIKFYDFNLKEISKDLKNIDWDANVSDKNGYEDFMLKEIFEQPKSIRETIGTILKDNKVDFPDLDKINFSKFNKIYIVACGTAMHAGISAKYIFERFCKINTEVDMASEFRYRNPLIDKKTLCIFISQSGETADTIAALKLAKEKKSTTIAIVNVIGSSITRLADYCLYTHAGPEIAVASTKAYTCQVTLLSLLAIYISEKINTLKNKKFDAEDEKEIEVLKNDIASLPNKVKKTLDNVNDLTKKLADKCYKCHDIFFIGRGTDYATSMEGSLKLKEISYIHSEAQASGELKHGPIALIEKGVPVIGIATNEITDSKTFSNLEEVISRGANVILITNSKSTIPDIIDSNNIIKIPSISHYLSSIISVIPLQLINLVTLLNQLL